MSDNDVITFLAVLLVGGGLIAFDHGEGFFLWLAYLVVVMT